MKASIIVPEIPVLILFTRLKKSGFPGVDHVKNTVLFLYVYAALLKVTNCQAFSVDSIALICLRDDVANHAKFVSSVIPSKYLSTDHEATVFSVICRHVRTVSHILYFVPVFCFAITPAQSIAYSHPSNAQMYPYAPLNSPDIIMIGFPMLSLGRVSNGSMLTRSGHVASASIVNSPVPSGRVFPVGRVTMLKYMLSDDQVGQRSVHVFPLR